MKVRKRRREGEKVDVACMNMTKKKNRNDERKKAAVCLSGHGLGCKRIESCG